MTGGTYPLITEKQIRRKSRSRDEICSLGCGSGDRHGPGCYLGTYQLPEAEAPICEGVPDGPGCAEERSPDPGYTVRIPVV